MKVLYGTVGLSFVCGKIMVWCLLNTNLSNYRCVLVLYKSHYTTNLTIWLTASKTIKRVHGKCPCSNFHVKKDLFGSLNFEKFVKFETLPKFGSANQFNSLDNQKWANTYELRLWVTYMSHNSSFFSSNKWCRLMKTVRWWVTLTGWKYWEGSQHPYKGGEKEAAAKLQAHSFLHKWPWRILDSSSTLNL